jgi:putative PIN family toxin of toxin-antitoxin system
MRIVVDTNVLLTSIGRKSYTRWLFDAIIGQSVTLLITNEILTEYREIIAQRANETVAENVTGTLVNLASVEKVEVYFYWRLITADPDDNKFIDCAISGNADYIVTYDNHFNVLANIDFPEVKVIIPERLKELLGLG